MLLDLHGQRSAKQVYRSDRSALLKSIVIFFFLFPLKGYLTQNMQDRQTQVRAGPARAAGRLRETDGMVTGRSDDAAAATDQWASLSIIQPGEQLPNTAQP